MGYEMEYERAHREKNKPMEAITMAAQELARLNDFITHHPSAPKSQYEQMITKIESLLPGFSVQWFTDREIFALVPQQKVER